MPVEMASLVDYTQLRNDLELQELESPGGTATPQVYGQLLALYLLENDTNNARYLWKRIPVQIKTANAELGLIWGVGQKMWTRDFPGIYETLQKDWSENVKHIMAKILESTRKRALNLVAQAYSSISGEDFASFMGMPVTEAVDGAVAEGWEADAQTRMIMPKKPAPVSDPVLPSEQQLERLTDFVTFLEN